MQNAFSTYKMKLRKSLVVAGLLMAGLLSSCGGGGAGGGVAVSRVKTMVIHVLSDPQGINPFITTDALTTYIENMVFENLIVLDANTLELRPLLAEALPTISDDHTIITFKINPKAKFSDGRSVTAADVVFSYKAVMNPECETANARAELHHFTDCRAIDDHTVEFRLDKSGPMNLNRFAIHFTVMPRHIYDPAGHTEKYTCAEASQAATTAAYNDDLKSRFLPFANQFNDEKYKREPGYIVGSGRYVFDQWKNGQMLRLVKNRNYWNAGASEPFAAQNMDTLIYKTINDLETALVSLKNGEIDFSHHFDPAQYKEKMTGENFEAGFSKKSVPYPAYEYIGWNMSVAGSPNKNFFSDKRVRWAMAYLVDVNAYVENITYGQFHPITSMVYHERPEYNKELKAIQPNEEKARALLLEAGWADTDNDGVLDKNINGQQVRFEFSIYYRKGVTIREQIALNMQQSLKKVGIIVNPQPLEANYLRTRLEKHDVEAWIAGWAYDSDEQDYYSLFHSSQIPNGGFNWGGYYNPDADRIMEMIQTEWDQAKRYELHRQIQALLYDEQPYTLLFGQNFLIGYNKRLENSNWYKQRPCYDPPQFSVATGTKEM